MKGQIVGGVRIKPIQPTLKTKSKPIFTQDNFAGAHAKSATVEMIKQVYDISADMETLYNDYVKENSNGAT